MRVTDKGQITIPKQLRDELGIEPGTTVEFERAGDAVLVRRTKAQPSRGIRIVERMRGRGDIAMTTDQLMALTRGEPDES